MRVLVVEDEINLQMMLKKRLTKEGYSVDACGNGKDAADYVESASYDIVLLDIMIPGRSGLQLLKEIRTAGNMTPVLLLTAKDGIADRVQGLDCGADDYMVKPFAFEELLARIRALLRRPGTQLSDRLTAGDLIMDLQNHTVIRDDRPIELSSKEFSILEYLLRNQGIVLSRDKIEQHAWNYDYEGGSNVIDVYIRYLRKKIHDPFPKKLIHTVRGAGYVLRWED